MLAFNKSGIDDLRRLPRLVFDVREPEDFKLIAEALPNLVDVGMPIPHSWIQNKLRIPVPKEGEAVLTRMHNLYRVLNRPLCVPQHDSGPPLSQTDLDEFEAAADELARHWEQQATNSSFEGNNTAIACCPLMRLR